MAVGRGVLVGAHAEGLPEGTADRGEETARHAGGRCRLRHGGLGAVRLLPAVGGGVQPVAGQHPGAAHAEFLGDRRDRTAGRGHREVGRAALGDLGVLRLHQVGHLLGHRGVRRRLVRAGVAGLQTEVLGVGGQEVAGAHVAGAQPLAPRHPLRCEDGVGAGQQDRLVDGDDLGAGGAGDGDGPAPATVAGLPAPEEVRDDAVALGDQPLVLPHDPGRGGLLGGGAGEVDGLGAQTVGGAASRCRCAHRYRFSPTPSHGCATPSAGGGRSGQRDRVDVRATTCSRARLHPFCGMAEIRTLPVRVPWAYTDGASRASARRFRSGSGGPWGLGRLRWLGALPGGYCTMHRLLGAL